MTIAYKDYYAILGVPRDASAADIKKAFRRLARQYHPDVAKDASTAEARFKELNEANAVLSDPESRRRYDALGPNWQDHERASTHTPRGSGDPFHDGPGFRFEGTGFSDFFEQFFGSRGGPSAGFGSRGGTRSRGATFRQPGEDLEGDLMVTLEEVVRGSTRVITLQRTDPRTGLAREENLRVRIPAGVGEGQRIRLAGKGYEGQGGGEPGDLFLRVRYAAHPEFQASGADLHFELDLAPWEAVLGTTVRIPTLDGAVDLKVPAGTSSGQELRLRGRGLPRGDGTRGDLFATSVVHVPAQVTPEQKALWEQLASGATFDPRSTP